MDDNNIEVKVSGSSVYKAVRNWMVNEQQMTSDKVEQIIRNETEKQFVKAFKEIDLSRLLINAFNAVESKGFRDIYSKTPFEQWVQKEMKEAIQRHIKENYSFNISKVKKEDL